MMVFSGINLVLWSLPLLVPNPAAGACWPGWSRLDGVAWRGVGGVARLWGCLAVDGKDILFI